MNGYVSAVAQGLRGDKGEPGSPGLPGFSGPKGPPVSATFDKRRFKDYYSFGFKRLQLIFIFWICRVHLVRLALKENRYHSESNMTDATKSYKW